MLTCWCLCTFTIIATVWIEQIERFFRNKNVRVYALLKSMSLSNTNANHNECTWCVRSIYAYVLELTFTISTFRMCYWVTCVVKFYSCHSSCSVANIKSCLANFIRFKFIIIFVYGVDYYLAYWVSIFIHMRVT